MQLLAAIETLGELVANARRVPLTDQVRLDASALRAGAERLRRAFTSEFGLLPGSEPPIRAAAILVGELETIVEAARPVPLTPEVRVERGDVLDRLDRLRRVVPEALEARGASFEPPRWAAAVAAIDELDDALHHARHVPLTDQVRLEGDELAGRVAQLRSALTETTPGSRASALMDDIEATTARAKRIPATGQVRVRKPPLRAGLAELRQALVDAA